MTSPKCYQSTMMSDESNSKSKESESPYWSCDENILDNGSRDVKASN